MYKIIHFLSGATIMMTKKHMSILYFSFFYVSAPGEVRRFEVVRRGSSHLLVRWEPPEVLNGILIGYSIGYEGEW